MQSNAPVEVRAQNFVGELARGDWDHPQTVFDAAMSSAMPAAKLHALWGVLEDAAGSFGGIEGAHVQARHDLQVVLVTCKFERIRKVLRVVFDNDNKLTGLFYEPVPEDVEAKTRSLVTAAAHGSYDLASRDFGDVMKNALPPSKFAETWKAVEQKVGAWQTVEQIELKPEQGFWSSLATSRFERERLVVKVVYDARDEVTGLFFQPAAVAWSAPPYATPSAFEERAVNVGTAPQLPGVLTLPKGVGPVPAIVLVHGSGPNDKDESIGGVKVFKDLAWGLASRGIAVLRYVKRSRQAPTGITTQKDEVLDAAHDAVELLRNTAGIDANRIFVLGHSQGGYLAPRIAAGNPSLAGVVILAGSTRSLEDTLIDQFTYFASLDPKNAAVCAMLEAARKLKQVVEDPNLRADQDVPFPTGGSAKGAYFLDVRGYDPGNAARDLSCRLLVLQGERDYQVTMKDFDGWKRALTSKKDATLKTYPSLNHLFVSGSGTPTPSEYERPGHVEKAVIDDIAGWITPGRS